MQLGEKEILLGKKNNIEGKNINNQDNECNFKWNNWVSLLQSERGEILTKSQNKNTTSRMPSFGYGRVFFLLAWNEYVLRKHIDRKL